MSPNSLNIFGVQINFIRLHITRFPFFFQADCFEHSCLKSQGRFSGGILQKYSPCSTQSCIVFNALTNKTTSLLQQNCICFTKTAITFQILMNSCMIKLKTRELFTILLRYSSETLPTSLLGTSWVRDSFTSGAPSVNKSHTPSLPKIKLTYFLAYPCGRIHNLIS